MTIPLLQYLVCPRCGGTLYQPVNERGGLRCLRKQHYFPVINGVPRMVADEDADRQKQTTDSFSAKWATSPDYGYDPATDLFRFKWYLQRYGWTPEGYQSFLKTRKVVLDAGTGLGGQVKWYAEATKGQVFGVDISQSVDIAHEHLKGLPNAHIIQADITRLPFRAATFDFIAADQVLHHTPNTEAAFQKLVPLLAPGGQIVIYVYKKKAPLREMADDWIRERTTKVSWQECYEFSEQLSLLGRALTDLKAEVVIEKDIPLLGIKAGKQDVQRFLYWHFLKCFWNDQFDLKGNAIVNADWFHPAYAWRHTPEEVERWFKEAGLRILHEDVSESGISVRGLRE